MTKKLYVSRERADLVLHTGAGSAQFKGYSLTLNDEDEIQAKQMAELDEALITNASISSLISLVDQEEAERVVQAAHRGAAPA